MKKSIRQFRNGSIKLKIAALVIVLFISGWTSPLFAEKLVIGAVLPLSGPISMVGLAWQRGYGLYFDKMNEQGGIEIGNKKYIIDFYAEDSKISYEGARTAAMKLVHQRKANFVFGAIVDVATEGVYDITSSAGALNLIAWNLVPESSADVGKGRPLCVRPSITADDSQTVSLDYLAKAYPEAKTIFIIGADQYTSMIEKLKVNAKKRGLEVTTVSQWSIGVTDFIPYLSEPLSSMPDVVYSMQAAQSPYIVKQARQLGFKGPFISDAPLGPEVFLAVLGENVTDVISCGMDVLNSPTDVMKEVMKRWDTKYKEPFVSDSIMAWDEAWILVQAMQKAQSIDPEKVAKAFDNMAEKGSVLTSYGPAYMGGQERYGVNRVLMRRIPISHIMDGKSHFKGLYWP